MSAENASFGDRYGNVLIIAVAVVLVFVIFMYFRDRQQNRDLDLRRIDAQVEILEDWPPPPKRQPTNSPGPSGKIL